MVVRWQLSVFRHFPAKKHRHFFRHELAGIFFFFFLGGGGGGADILFRPEFAGISSYQKVPAYFPTQNCRHIFRPELAGIFSDPNLPAFFFDPKLPALFSTRYSICGIEIFIFFSFFGQLNTVYSIQLITRLANDRSYL